MATMAILAWLTPSVFSGGCVVRTAPIMNIMLIIQAAPKTRDFFLPKRSIPTIRKIPVATTLTVP